MKLVNDIIEQAIDDAVLLPVILRKCLVVATKLKNDRLKEWVLGELNGFDDKDALPQYRVIQAHAKGLFLGGFGSELRNQPLASGILDEEHRWWATTAYLAQGIASYEQLIKEPGKGNLQSHWPADLVIRYQRDFIQNMALNRAWQEIPVSSVIGLVDTVRNRLLEFALELQEEIGDTETPLEKIAPENVEKAVTTIIYGGHNVIASYISGDVQQVGELNVIKGDFVSLTRVLESVGVQADEIGALEKAIAGDKKAGEKKDFGKRTSKWLSTALTSVGKGGAQAIGDVAKTTLNKAVMAYLGLN